MDYQISSHHNQMLSPDVFVIQNQCVMGGGKGALCFRCVVFILACNLYMFEIRMNMSVIC